MKIGPYFNVTPLAKTQNSVVFIGKTQKGRLVAIKVLPHEDARAELGVINRLHDSHIVRGYDSGKIRHRLEAEVQSAFTIKPTQPLGWFSMELVYGTDLSRLLKTTGAGLPAPLVIGQMLEISKALLPYWQQGGFYIDMKPANIIQALNRDWVLVDFGSAAKYSNACANGLRGSIKTTAYFAPPEYIEEDAVPALSGEFFSIGATIFRLLYNQYVSKGIPILGNILGWYRGHSPEEVFPNLIKDPYLLQFFRSACAFTPKQRVSDPAEFLGLLERAKENLEAQGS